ncbi:MAG: hypothetical protein ACKOWX_10245 [Flavobacteriales bacterium]
MSALTILGYCCLILFFTAIPISIIVMVLRDKPSTTPLDDEAQRELENNRVYIWEYFIVLLAVVLIAIGLLSNDQAEKQTSFSILSVAFSFLLMTSYNNRFDIAGVNRIVIAVCIMCGLTSVYLWRINFNARLDSGANLLVGLCLPLALYFYVRTVREIIFEITGTYPITLDKEFPVGYFSERYNREANYWDIIWTLWNFGLGVCLFMLQYFV